MIVLIIVLVANFEKISGIAAAHDGLERCPFLATELDWFNVAESVALLMLHPFRGTIFSSSAEQQRSTSWPGAGGDLKRPGLWIAGLWHSDQLVSSFVQVDLHVNRLIGQSQWSVVAPRLELETNLAYLPRIPLR